MSAAVQDIGKRLQPARQWWLARAPRERQLVIAAAAALLMLLLWLLAVQPALKVVRDAPKQQAQLDQQWQAMQRLAGEVRELHAAPKVSAAQSAAAIKAASGRLGESARLSLQGERAVLTLTNASTSQLRNLLAEVRSGARAQPVEANLTRAADGYSGTLVLALPGKP